MPINLTWSGVFHKLKQRLRLAFQNETCSGLGQLSTQEDWAGGTRLLHRRVYCSEDVSLGAGGSEGLVLGGGALGGRVRRSSWQEDRKQWVVSPPSTSEREEKSARFGSSSGRRFCENPEMDRVKTKNRDEITGWSQRRQVQSNLEDC